VGGDPDLTQQSVDQVQGHGLNLTWWKVDHGDVKNTGQIVIQCSGRNTQSCNKITTWTNSNYVKVIMSLMKDKSSMKYSLQCSGRNTEAESETSS